MTMALLAPPTVRSTSARSISAPTLPPKSARPVQIKRRSTLKRSIDETESIEIPSSPSKRSRVTFDSDVEILSADEDDSLDPALIKEQVRRAIERHKVHDEETYDRIRAVFSTPHNDPNAQSTTVLRVHLQAVLAHVTSLGRECAGLVNAILQSEWVGREESYYVLFVRFLGNLAAAQRGYQGHIIHLLVDLLGPQKTRRVKDARPVRQRTIHRRVQRAIQHIVSIIPSATGSLVSRLAARLDFEFQKAEERMCYIRNFMDMTTYVPEITSDILAAVLRELIKLDVSVQADLDDDDEELEDEIMQYMTSSQLLLMNDPQQRQNRIRSELYGNEDDQDDEYVSSSDESDIEEAEEDPNSVEVRRRKLKENIRQVDLIMELLFQHYTKLTSSSSHSVRHNAIEQLISQFHTLILPTYRSRHPQFLVFHFCQTDPIIIDQFVTSCVAVFVDPRQSQILRHSAAAYFSGFVGRGAHVSPSVVRDCLSLLCDQLTKLRQSYEPLCRAPDLKRFGDFYSAFQAILYIFCFRWRDIASSTSDLEDSDSDDEDEYNTKKAQDYYHFPPKMIESIHQAIYSNLNPLKVCTPVIVDQFAKLTRSLEILYLYPKIEQNKHVRLFNSHHASVNTFHFGGSGTDSDASWLSSDGMLEGYFPYDPYDLPISRRWIEGDYVEWKRGPGVGDVDDVMDSSDEVDDLEDEEDDDDDNGGMEVESGGETSDESSDEEYNDDDGDGHD